MATINEIKEQMTVVGSVGNFTNALQQIATQRMVRLRSKVLASRPFVEAAQEVLAELTTIRDNQLNIDLRKIKNENALEPVVGNGRAVIIITSNAGLTGLYNIEILQKVKKILDNEQGSEFFVVGKKGQEAFAGGKYKVTHFPYEVKEDFSIDDLRRLTNMFDSYHQVNLIYSKYINSAKREIVYSSVTTPQAKKEDGSPEITNYKFTCEPNIQQLISGVTASLRAALFQQQIFDARLSQNAAQMIGMKTASDNATSLLGELQMDYNKQRRKLIDKKIGEVFAGSALW